MMNYVFSIFLLIFAVLLFPALYLTNYFYQKRADNFADNLLKDNPELYEQQIKSNAYRYLTGRSGFGILWGISIFYFTWNQPSKLSFLIPFHLFICLGLIFWGYIGYKSELKKLDSLK